MVDPFSCELTDGCQGSALCIQVPAMWVKMRRNTKGQPMSASLVASDVDTEPNVSSERRN